MNRILVIDDSELITNLLKESLVPQGFEVRCAGDANKGYEADIEFQPELILLDVQLPDVQGFDLIRIIKNREELKHIPIIMVTGTHHQTDHKVKALQAGADDYVLKPFEMPELIERIRAVLRRSAPSAATTREKPATFPQSPGPMGKLSAFSHPAGSSKPLVVDVGSEKSNHIQILSLGETFFRALVCPQQLEKAVTPPVTMPYLAALLTLSLGGWSISAGSTVKPALIGLGTLGFWGLCVAMLVMTCSILGISLSWKEGARVICLAGLPLLLKLLGGVTMTLLTSLSPFYFTASPAIFIKSTSFLVERLDIFELWMIWLVWVMVKQCRGSTNQKALAAAAIVWPIAAYWQSLWKQ